jgi:DNA primase
VLGQSATIATPLLWEEVKEGLQLEDFNPETIFKRLKQIGDPFEGLLRKKVNAETLLDRMETNYSFLF